MIFIPIWNTYNSKIQSLIILIDFEQLYEVDNSLIDLFILMHLQADQPASYAGLLDHFLGTVAHFVGQNHDNH